MYVEHMEKPMSPKTEADTYVWMRYQTLDKAVSGAGRLSAKYGSGKFAVRRDAVGGTFAPFAVFSAPK